MLILTPLKDALNSLEDILNQTIDEYVRDGVIQRFEYTFELAWKMINRYFKEIGIKDIPSGPKPIIREAAKLGIITSVDDWFKFLEARNLASHTYNEDFAQNVYLCAKDFPKFVKELIINLEK